MTVPPRLMIPFLLLAAAAACQPPIASPTATATASPTPRPALSATPPPARVPPVRDFTPPVPLPEPLFPPAAPPTSPDEQAQHARAAAQARALAAKVLDAPLATVQVRGVKSVIWPDRGLGCLPASSHSGTAAPQPTPGFLVTVEVAGQVYAVHLSATGQGLICPRK